MTNHSSEFKIVFRAPDGTDFILLGQNKLPLASLPRQGETVTLLDGEDVLVDDGVVEDVKWMIAPPRFLLFSHHKTKPRSALRPLT